MRRTLQQLLVTSAGALLLAVAPASIARAHCDTMDGPVVRAAERALASGDVAHVLIWVRPQDERTIREAFARTRAARTQGAAARELADLWFFETLVRVHREGEGAPYTGLKPAGAPEHPAVAAADSALAAGKVDVVERVLLHAVRDGLRARFQEALAKKGFAPSDVAAGRAYVDAYVPFLHYAEAIYDAAHAATDAHGASPGSASGEHRP